MTSQESVQYNLEYFQVDDDEAGIDNKMEQGHQGVPEHFFLTESKQEYIAPALSLPVAEIFFLAQQNITAYLPDMAGKQPYGGDGYQCKY